MKHWPPDGFFASRGAFAPPSQWCLLQSFVAVQDWTHNDYLLTLMEHGSYHAAKYNNTYGLRCVPDERCASSCGPMRDDTPVFGGLGHKIEVTSVLYTEGTKMHITCHSSIITLEMPPITSLPPQCNPRCW
eukprot:Blabericola_migrator_1__6871@NODE_347_length_9536_cov_48_697223_g279_i0_p3_GENE_NODE_347_length_9536_cov_48_697223_g279_i0NODE_347_length_9536_cov_48_697223_g279_i0_p3_ORF_typecomplete_len131_score9_70_NODE_347_length_9536_cov_48_697223_g279_i040774469